MQEPANWTTEFWERTREWQKEEDLERLKLDVERLKEAEGDRTFRETWQYVPYR